MASVISLCNLALAHVGDPGLITSIDPPDGSAQAARCAVYYPLARRFLLESHTWSFATARQSLANLDDETNVWSFRYTKPSNALRVAKILSPLTAADEPSAPFLTEVNGSGEVTILTDTEDASCVYVYDQLDLTRFTPMAYSALSFLLASYIAGPLVKGKAGMTVAKELYQRYLVDWTMAKTSDASQHKIDRSAVLPASIRARA